MATQKKREMYDAADYVKKMDAMIEKLRTRPPGEPVGQVGKNNILAMRREALQQLIKDGYTVQQIAEAMKDDVFSILPKTITEIVTPKTNNQIRARAKKVKAAKVAATETKNTDAKESENIDATESTLNVEVNADKKNKTAAARNKPNNFVDI
jgi:hypothetical protein